MTVCRPVRALSSVSRILFSVRMMSDGLLSTGSSSLVGHSCLGRRYFDGEAVDDQMSCPFNSVVIQLCRRDAANIIDVSREMPRSALHTVLLFLSTAAEVYSVVELYRPNITH